MFKIDDPLQKYLSKRADRAQQMNGQQGSTNEWPQQGPGPNRAQGQQMNGPDGPGPNRAQQMNPLEWAQQGPGPNRARQMNGPNRAHAICFRY